MCVCVKKGECGARISTARCVRTAKFSSSVQTIPQALSLSYVCTCTHLLCHSCLHQQKLTCEKSKERRSPDSHAKDQWEWLQHHQSYSADTPPTKHKAGTGRGVLVLRTRINLLLLNKAHQQGAVLSGLMASHTNHVVCFGVYLHLVE